MNGKRRWAGQMLAGFRDTSRKSTGFCAQRFRIESPQRAPIAVAVVSFICQAIGVPYTSDPLSPISFFLFKR